MLAYLYHKPVSMVLQLSEIYKNKLTFLPVVNPLVNLGASSYGEYSLLYQCLMLQGW